MEQPLTMDRAAAEAIARQRLSPNGGTSLFDQLIRMGKYMRNSAKFQSRDIVVISDGADNASTTTLDDVQQQMKLPGSPTVHFLVLPPSRQDRSRAEEQHIKRDTLQLTEVGGGLTYFPANAKELAAAVDHLDTTIQRRYVLQYKNSNPASDGKERKIEWKATGRKLVVRGPQVYVAPSP